MHVTVANLRKVEFEYDGETFRFSTPVVYAVCFFVGIAGGIYGIGGGSIVAPFFVAIIGLPVYAIAGAALMGTLVTSVAGVFFFHILAQFYSDLSVAPDWHLGLLFGLGEILSRAHINPLPHSLNFPHLVCPMKNVLNLFVIKSRFLHQSRRINTFLSSL